MRVQDRLADRLAEIVKELREIQSASDEGDIFKRVMAEMQNAEECGGPTDGDYLDLMGRIATEATRRAKICRERMEAEWEVVRKIHEAHKPFPVGARVVTLEPIDRFPHFMVGAGRTGTVSVSDDHTLAVKMDDPIAGAEEWDNEIVWYENDRLYAAEDIALAVPYAVMLLTGEERAP